MAASESNSSLFRFLLLIEGRGSIRSAAAWSQSRSGVSQSPKVVVLWSSLGNCSFPSLSMSSMSTISDSRGRREDFGRSGLRPRAAESRAGVTGSEAFGLAVLPRTGDRVGDGVGKPVVATCRVRRLGRLLLCGANCSLAMVSEGCDWPSSFAGEPVTTGRSVWCK